MKIVTIIPARGGSKGIPLKNIRSVGGVPLISRAVESSVKCNRISKTYVSTDSELIAAKARLSGADIIWRTQEISNDVASSESVLLFSIGQMSEKPDLVVFLQCTSPFIKPEYIEEMIDDLISTNSDSALAVVKNHHFIWRSNDLGEAYGVNHDGKNRLRRQDMQPEFMETGAIYVFRTDAFLREKTRFCGKTIVHCFDDEKLGFEIDSPVDLQIAQALANIHEQVPSKINKNIKLILFDFDGVFTDNKVYVSEDGVESVRCDRGDGLGLELLKKLRPDIRLVVISKEKNSVVQKRCEKLRIDCYQAIDNKLEVVNKICDQHGFNLTEVAYIGNDLNDLECMRHVGFSICPSDAVQAIRLQADLILNAKGGEGAVRELCDILIEK